MSVLEDLLIAALGNPLMGDDGVGRAVLDRLLELPLPSGVRTADLGSDSLLLPAAWEGEGRIWLVDALVRGAPAGSLHLLEHDEVLGLQEERGAAHHQSLALNLRWILHCFPSMNGARFRLFGIEPESVEPRPALSRAVERAARDTARAIRSELAGVAFRANETPSKPTP